MNIDDAFRLEKELRVFKETNQRLLAERNRVREMVYELARFIQEEIPGEPSRSEGAVECAIRLLRAAYVKEAPVALEPQPRVWLKEVATEPTFAEECREAASRLRQIGDEL